MISMLNCRVVRVGAGWSEAVWDAMQGVECRVLVSGSAGLLSSKTQMVVTVAWQVVAMSRC